MKKPKVKKPEGKKPERKMQKVQKPKVDRAAGTKATTGRRPPVPDTRTEVCARG